MLTFGTQSYATDDRVKLTDAGKQEARAKCRSNSHINECLNEVWKVRNSVTDNGVVRLSHFTAYIQHIKTFTDSILDRRFGPERRHRANCTAQLYRSTWASYFGMSGYQNCRYFYKLAEMYYVFNKS